jgi:hypothetical protein
MGGQFKLLFRCIQAFRHQKKAFKMASTIKSLYGTEMPGGEIRSKTKL